MRPQKSTSSRPVLLSSPSIFIMEARQPVAHHPSTTLNLLTELLQGCRHPAVFGTDQGAVLCMNAAAVRSIAPKFGETGDAIPADWHRRITLQVDGQTFHLAMPDPKPSVIPVANLPPRLVKITRLVTSGLTDKQIASHTGLSFCTVRTYVRQIYRQFGVHSRVELVHAAV